MGGAQGDALGVVGDVAPLLGPGRIGGGYRVAVDIAIARQGSPVLRLINSTPLISPRVLSPRSGRWTRWSRRCRGLEAVAPRDSGLGAGHAPVGGVKDVGERRRGRGGGIALGARRR